MYIILSVTGWAWAAVVAIALPILLKRAHRTKLPDTNGHDDEQAL